ncbi:class I SAM-dependent methyltransferase [Falsiroseomonas oryziterrae]|uniref:class I SAM-dependent methyltransferase n=1 Tax=Falsiroseomonas oryziterrae TaxID=2911368 RepID=UPI001F30FF3D|nr:class I SAM-dependent methyltransferase [Roseomonas sp. NPKOSM-4]
MDLKETAILGEDIEQHWYFRAKRAALLQLVAGLGARRVLDVGAGSGFFARALLERTAIAEATCLDPFYASDRDETVEGKPLRFRRAAAPGDADLIVMMDVLEHVEDDLDLLAEHAGAAAPGTDVLISVPALRWMWSGHDVFLEHHRRYTLEDVTQLTRAAGLEVVRGMYFFAGVLPFAMLARAPDLIGRVRGQPVVARSGLRRHSRPVNALLGALCRLELPLMARNRTIGLSVFMHARKPSVAAQAATARSHGVRTPDARAPMMAA